MQEEVEKVSDNKVLIGVALVALFWVGVVVGVFWPSPAGEEVAQVALEAPDSEYQPWDETLALTSPLLQLEIPTAFLLLKA